MQGGAVFDEGCEQGFRMVRGNGRVGNDGKTETGKAVIFEEFRGFRKQAAADDHRIRAVGKGDMDGGHGRRLDFRLGNIKEEGAGVVAPQNRCHHPFIEAPARRRPAPGFPAIPVSDTSPDFRTFQEINTSEPCSQAPHC